MRVTAKKPPGCLTSWGLFCGFGLGGLGGAAAGALALRFFLVADGLGFVAVRAKVAPYGFFHGHNGVVKFPLGLAGFVGGGFGLGSQFCFLLLHILHGLPGDLQKLGGGLGAGGGVAGDGPNALKRLDILQNVAAWQAAAGVDNGHRVHLYKEQKRTKLAILTILQRWGIAFGSYQHQGRTGGSGLSEAWRCFQ